MSSDDDQEELAQLRAQRAARTGAASTLSQLREQQQRAHASTQQGVYQAEQARSHHEKQHQKPHQQADDDEDDDEVEAPADAMEEEAMVHDGLRGEFPMAFGIQESQVVREEEVHSKTVRPKFGPAKPGGIVIKPPSFGPLRPPAAQSDADKQRAAEDKALAIAAATAAAAAAATAGPSSSPAAADDDLVGPPRPPADDDAEDDLVGPPRPAADDDDGDEGGGGGESDEDVDEYHLPVTHEVVMGGHSKAVTCMDIDHSGSRIVTGSLDYTVRLYDFNGMKADLRAFRSLEPCEGHPVLAVSWSPTGDAFLAVTGAGQAKIYDRDAHVRGEFMRGDMYIRDMKNTKGHIAALTSGQWHPVDRNSAMTSSEDGTVRIWDCTEVVQKTVIKPQLAKPVRTAVTTCSYSSDGNLIAAGLMDGSIQLWSTTGKFGSSAAVGQVPAPKQQMIAKQDWKYVSKASQVARAAHEAQSEITCLAFSQDSTSLLSRGMDGSMKLWDLRKLSQPVDCYTGLPTNYPTTKCLFSPDERLLITGMSAGAREEGGALVVVDRAKREVVRKIGMPASVAGLAWHHRLNQVFVGIGDRKSGATHVLYDTTFSERGVLQCVGRQPRKANPFDFQIPMQILAPHALPMYREAQPHKKRKLDKEAREARKPDLGAAAGVGKQGRIGTTGGTLLTQHLMKQKGKLVSVEEEADAREMILRHAGKTDAFNRFTDAYATTQPKPVFAQEEEEEEEEEGDGEGQ